MLFYNEKNNSLTNICNIDARITSCVTESCDSKSNSYAQENQGEDYKYNPSASCKFWPNR